MSYDRIQPTNEKVHVTQSRVFGARWTDNKWTIVNVIDACWPHCSWGQHARETVQSIVSRLPIEANRSNRGPHMHSGKIRRNSDGRRYSTSRRCEKNRACDDSVGSKNTSEQPSARFNI